MSKIQWTDESWNPVIGCTKVSAGCKNCYAERMAQRLYWMGMAKPATLPEYMSFEEGWKDGHIELCEHRLDKPLHWRKPRRIFVCSMSDLFHEKVPFEFIFKILAIIHLCPQHTFLILTKRPDKMGSIFVNIEPEDIIYQARKIAYGRGVRLMNMAAVAAWPIYNLHLGVTCENQKTADERIPILLQIPAAVRFVSVEPMLEPIDITKYLLPTFLSVDGHCWKPRPVWGIVGCESGPNRRECKTEWVRDFVGQCQAANVPVFVKQLSINGKVEHDIHKFPKDLQVRQYPEN